MTPFCDRLLTLELGEARIVLTSTWVLKQSMNGWEVGADQGLETRHLRLLAAVEVLSVRICPVSLAAPRPAPPFPAPDW